MAAASIDANTWYTLQNVANGNYLGVAGNDKRDPEITWQSSPHNWQFMDTGVATDATGSHSWLVRPQDYSTYCLDVVSESTTLTQCSANTRLWKADFAMEAWTLVSPSDDILTEQSPVDNVLHILSTHSFGNDLANDQFTLSPQSYVNDESWSTLPYSSPAAATGVPSGESFSPNLVPVVHHHDLLDKRADVPSVTYANIARRSSPNGPFSTAIVDQQLTTLDDGRGNIGCENCTVAGVAVVEVGGYDNTTTNATVALDDFAQNGYVDVTVSDLQAQMALDFQLLPDFGSAQALIPICATIASVDITELLTLQFVLDVGIPLSIPQISNVTFAGGFLVSLDQATIRINVGSVEMSSSSGWSNAEVQLLPFRASTPDVAFSATTGLAFRLNMLAIAHTENVTANSSVVVTVDVPGLDLSTQPKINVDDECNVPMSRTVNERALSITSIATTRVAGRGRLQIEDANRTILYTDASGFPARSTTLQVESQCLFGDRVSAQFLVNDTANGASTGWSSLRGSIWGAQSLCSVLAFIFAFLV